MDDSLKYFERIDDYLLGGMSPRESALFEQEMQQDIELLRSVTLQRDLLKGVQKFGDVRLKHQLTEIETTLQQKGFFLNEEHILQYLQQELDPTLINVFENRLKQDEAFAKEVEFQKTVLSGIEKFGSVSEAEEIKKVEEQLAREGFFDAAQKKEQTPVIDIDRNIPGAKTISLFSRRNLAIAASVLLLITISIYYTTRPDAYDQAFADNFQPETTRLENVLDDLESSGMGIPDKQRRAALLAILLKYESGSYKEITSTFQNHLQTYPDDHDARFYYGVTLLQTREYQKAKDQFQTIMDNTIAWEKEAKWYLALSRLKMKKDHSEAVHILQEIAGDKNSPYQEKAINLLEGLGF